MIKKMRRKRRISPLQEKLKENPKFNYKDSNLIRSFTTTYGKILAKRVTGITKKQQKSIKKAIKQDRILSLLPFLRKKALNKPVKKFIKKNYQKYNSKKN